VERQKLSGAIMSPLMTYQEAAKDGAKRLGLTYVAIRVRESFLHVQSRPQGSNSLKAFHLQFRLGLFSTQAMVTS
jgi:hypothetical protein